MVEMKNNLEKPGPTLITGSLGIFQSVKAILILGKNTDHRHWVINCRPGFSAVAKRSRPPCTEFLVETR